jgi:hypothetical protein
MHFEIRLWQLLCSHEGLIGLYDNGDNRSKHIGGNVLVHVGPPSCV